MGQEEIWPTTEERKNARRVTLKNQFIRKTSEILSTSYNFFKKALISSAVTILLSAMVINIVPEGRHIFLNLNGETNFLFNEEHTGKSMVHTFRNSDLGESSISFQTGSLRDDSGAVGVLTFDNWKISYTYGKWGEVNKHGRGMQWSDREP